MLLGYYNIISYYATIASYGLGQEHIIHALKDLHRAFQLAIQLLLDSLIIIRKTDAAISEIGHS